MDRDLSIGPLRLITVDGPVKETLGDTLEAVGAALTPAERRPRPFDLPALPVRGLNSDDANKFLFGERLRRQVRALLENPAARLSPLWFDFVIDPQLACWLLIGGGDLAYGDGGVGFADYELTLSDCYRVGSVRTHRLARRLEVYDRRDPAVARDYLGRLFSDDFSDVDVLPTHWLPVGASDATGPKGAIVPLAAATSLEGDALAMSDGVHGQAVSFEPSTADFGKTDVRAFDRQGHITPSLTLAGDLDPEGEYGWEGLYGPDQELTADDAPVLQNGFCRIRWYASRSVLVLDVQDAGVGYVEQARVALLEDFPDGTENLYDTLVSARLVEWTPERAVMRLVLTYNADSRAEAYVTLQRGWLAPRLELYSRGTSGTPHPVMRLVANSAVGLTYGNSTGGMTDGTFVVTDGADLGDFVDEEPWAYIIPATAGVTATEIAVVQEEVTVRGHDDTLCYPGTRDGVSFVGPDDYLSLTLCVGGEITGGIISTTAKAIAIAHGQMNLADCRQTPGLVSR